MAKLGGGAGVGRRMKKTPPRIDPWLIGAAAKLAAAVPDPSAVASPTIRVAGGGFTRVTGTTFHLWASSGERKSSDFAPPGRSGINRSFVLPWWEHAKKGRLEIGAGGSAPPPKIGGGPRFPRRGQRWESPSPARTERHPEHQSEKQEKGCDEGKGSLTHPLASALLTSRRGRFVRGGGRGQRCRSKQKPGRRGGVRRGAAPHH